MAGWKVKEVQGVRDVKSSTVPEGSQICLHGDSSMLDILPINSHDLVMARCLLQAGCGMQARLTSRTNRKCTGEEEEDDDDDLLLQ